MSFRLFLRRRGGGLNVPAGLGLRRMCTLKPPSDTVVFNGWDRWDTLLASAVISLAWYRGRRDRLKRELLSQLLYERKLCADRLKKLEKKLEESG